MDLESVFDGPLSTGSPRLKSEKGLSVWQAEVALRLSKSEREGVSVCIHGVNELGCGGT